MRNADIATMRKVLLALEMHLPSNEKALLAEYTDVFERYNAKNENQKRAYQDKAEYYRDYTRVWQKNNPEKKKVYGKRYTNKKRLAKQNANGDANENPSLLEELEKNQKSIQKQAEYTSEHPQEKSKDSR